MVCPGLGLKFIYVVDARNQVEYRRVTTGALQEDGLREITQGVKADDRFAEATDIIRRNGGYDMTTRPATAAAVR